MIRLAQPWMDEREQEAVRRVLESGMLVQGAEVARFEQALARICGQTHAIACGSGTVALELALVAIGVEGGEVLCPALTWPSPAHAIVRAGGRPVLVDVDATWNASAEQLASAHTSRTRAAIAIDQFGMPADHPAIARALGDVPIVVDAACSIGSTIDGAPSASFGAIACTSFHPRKVVTTGEGGAMLTGDESVAARLRTLRNHGQREPGEFAEAAGNQRMTEIAAAIGLAQLEKLEAILARRRAIGARYREALRGRELQAITRGADPNWQTLGVVLESQAQRDEAIASLRARGIEAGRLSYALSRLPSLAAFSRPCPNAERIAACGMALPLHPRLTDEEQARVIEALA